MTDKSKKMRRNKTARPQAGQRAEAESLEAYDFPVGSVVGFLGLKGEVKVRPATNNPDLLLGVKHVLVRQKGQSGDCLLPVQSAHCDRRLLIMRFGGYTDRTSVEPLVGSELFARQSELAQLSCEEFWVKDLVGLRVFTTDGREIGSVCSIICGGNDLIEISSVGDPAGKTILVPFVKKLVPTVDLPGGRIEVVDLPGLLEPQ